MFKKFFEEQKQDIKPEKMSREFNLPTQTGREEERQANRTETGEILLEIAELIKNSRAKVVPIFDENGKEAGVEIVGSLGKKLFHSNRIDDLYYFLKIQSEVQKSE